MRYVTKYGGVQTSFETECPDYVSTCCLLLIFPNISWYGHLATHC